VHTRLDTTRRQCKKVAANFSDLVHKSSKYFYKLSYSVDVSLDVSLIVDYQDLYWTAIQLYRKCGAFA
jgi:hypothetical protein